MRVFGVILLAVVIGQLAVGSRALAAQPASQPPAQPAPPASPPPAGPPDPYAAPPPSYGSVPPGYGYGPMPMSPVQSLMMYEAQRKNAGLAILLEFVLPGLGSLYGDHAVGALVTWALMIAGIALVVYGATQWVDSYDSMTSGQQQKRDNSAGTFGLTAGIVLLLGGRIYGFVDSYMSTEEYNRKLKAKYGLPVVINWGVGRVGSGPAMSLGPRLTVSF